MFEEKLPATTVKDVESLGAKVKEYEKRLAAYSNLEVCEAKIVEQELKLANSILKIQLEAAINRAEGREETQDRGQERKQAGRKEHANEEP